LVTNSKDIIKNSNIVKNANTVNPDLDIHTNIFISENKKQTEISDLFIPGSKIESNNNMERFSIGAKSLDDLLGGGLEPKTITQLCGPSGSGKTTICFTSCAELPSPFKSVYIDTEGTFRKERIIQIAKARKINISLQNILVSQVLTTSKLEKCIDGIDELVQSDPTIKLIIIDSMTNLYRVEYLGRANLSQRQQQLMKYMYKLRQLAVSKKLVVVITNQVYSDHSKSYQKDTSVGGYTMDYPCTNIVKLLKRNNFNITAELLKSPYHAYDFTYLYIDEKGISDDEENIERLKKIERSLESNRE
jgi:DNA repair protein RadA